MGAEEGADGPGVAATGLAEHIRRHDPRSPRALDRRPVARHVPTSERRIRVVQPDGGPPQRKVHAPSGPQGWVLRERLPGRPASTIAGVHGSDRPPGQADPGNKHDRQHHFRRTGRARSEGFPETKMIRSPRIRLRKQPRNRKPGTRRKRKTRQLTRTRRRKKTRVSATQGTTTTTIHHQRPRTDRSTPKKQPVSRPKRKAYRNKSGHGSSSRKWTRNRW